MTISTMLNEETFHHYFQPIYLVNRLEKLGYEVLIRSSVFPNPENMFQEAKKQKRLYDLDSQSILKAIATYHSAGLSKRDGILFINVLPSTILNENFPLFLNQIINNNYLITQQIVFEISESEIIEEFERFKKRIIEIKQHGFLIAIDDIGKGYSNFQNIIELEPNYLKLDRYFSHDLHKSQKKRAIISLFINYCEQNNSQLILEGVENQEQLQVVKKLGINYAQGYYLCKPNKLQIVSK